MDGSEAERALAVSYAPADRREALVALLALDRVLGRIVAATGEPIVGQMRLTWWHDALERLDSDGPPAEPTLVALAQHVLPVVAGGELARLIDGWEVLLEPVDAAALAGFGAARGGTLFALAARLLGGEAVAGAGEGWALADLSRHHRDRFVAAEAAAMATPLLAGATAAKISTSWKLSRRSAVYSNRRAPPTRFHGLRSCN